MDHVLEILAYTSRRSSESNPILGVVSLVGLAGYLIYRKIKKIAQASMADLTLTVEKTAVQPGQELEVAVELIPKKDFQIRRAVVQLVRVETYIDRVRNEHSTSYSKETVEESVAEEVFVQYQDVQAMDSVATVMKFQVPQDTIPTMSGKITKGITPGVSWKIKTEFDITNKFDLEEEQKIIVNKPQEVYDLPYRPVVAESKHGMCTITMSIQTADIYKGNHFEGILRAEMHKEATISGVVIKLEGTEKFGDVATSLDIDEMTLDAGTTLQAGRIYDWPFQLDTYKANLPSLQLIKSKVEYSITGRLDIAMRRDPPVSQDVTIFI